MARLCPQQLWGNSSTHPAGPSRGLNHVAPRQVSRAVPGAWAMLLAFAAFMHASSVTGWCAGSSSAGTWMFTRTRKVTGKHGLQPSARWSGLYGHLAGFPEHSGMYKVARGQGSTGLVRASAALCQPDRPQGQPQAGGDTPGLPFGSAARTRRKGVDTGGHRSPHPPLGLLSFLREMPLVCLGALRAGGRAGPHGRRRSQAPASGMGGPF